MAARTQNVTLLDLKVSMFGMRVRIALAEKGVEYEHRFEDITNKSSLLLEMNPVVQKVPVLIHDGKPVCESLVIVQYIDEVWCDKNPLLPSDPYQRAQARFWGDFIDKKVNQLGWKIWANKQGEEQENAKKELIEVLKTLEGELGNKPFFGGQTFGFLDVALVAFYSWFYVYEKCGNFKIGAECPVLVAWAERCMQRESVAKSLADPKDLYEWVLQKKKAMGIE